MKDKKIEKIVLRYSGAAAAILGAQAAHGQIIYTDIPDTTLSTNGAYLDINLDDDTSGVMDFRITQLVDTTSAQFSGVIISTENQASNQVLGLDYGIFNYPFKLNEGDRIGKGEPFKGLHPTSRIGYLGLVVDDTLTYPNSQFTGGVTDGLIGVRFEADRDSSIRTFYGWIRIDVAADLRSVTIKGWAYEDSAGTEILAGWGDGIGLPEAKIELPQLAQRGRFIDINLPESFVAEAELKITDLSGKLLKTHLITERQTSLPLSGLPKGVLVATITSNGRQNSRKVVVY